MSSISYTKKIYDEKVIPAMTKEFSYKNPMMMPKLLKVCINSAFKTANIESSFPSYVQSQITAIAGQRAVIVKAKKSVSTFKLRTGMKVACKVTLRGDKMYEFLDRFLYIAMPRIRDFKGLSSKGMNQSLHYSFGINDQTIFPEIEIEKAMKIIGFNVSIVTTARARKECIALLKHMRFPIKNN